MSTWCSGEPSENIEAGLLRFAILMFQMLCLILSNSEFDDPDPPEHIVRSHAGALYTELAKSLKADCLKHTVISLPLGLRFLDFCLVVITKNVCISAILTNTTLVQGGISGSLTVWLVCMDMSLTSPSRPSCRCVGLHQIVFSDGTFSPKPRPLLETLTIRDGE